MEFLFIVFTLSYIVMAVAFETASDRDAEARRQKRAEFGSGFTVGGNELYQYIRRVRDKAFEDDFMSKTKDSWREIFGDDYEKILKRRARDFDIWKARLLMAAEGVMYDHDMSSGIGSFGIYDAETKLRICRAVEQKLRGHGRDVRFVIEPPPSFRKLKIKNPPKQGSDRWISYCSCVAEIPGAASRKCVRLWNDDTPVHCVSLEHDPTVR